MNRLYVAEPTPSVTGASADHRLAVRASEVSELAEWIHSQLTSGRLSDTGKNSGSEEKNRWASAVAPDLQKYRGKSLVIAGEHQPAAVHAMDHAINQSLANVGATVLYTEPVAAGPTNQL